MSMLYTQSHEWLMRNAADVTVGITDYGQKNLGEIVFVELPPVGRTVSKGQTLCVVESVKAASEILSPINGVVTSVNHALSEVPQLINSSAEQDGWLCALRIDDNTLATDQFLTAAQYQSLISG